MRQDVKELADAMERGWELVPKNCFNYFENEFGRMWWKHPIPISAVSAACAQGHALLGIGSTDISLRLISFPILESQKIKSEKDIMSLEDAINELIIVYKWSTLDVIEWLRNYQDK